MHETPDELRRLQEHLDAAAADAGAHLKAMFSDEHRLDAASHLGVRPAVSATHVPGQELSVTIHGRVELFDIPDSAHGELRQAMLDHYLPLQGSDFETWLRRENPIGARIAPEKIIALSFPS